MKKVLCAMIAAKIVQIYHFLASYVKMCYHVIDNRCGAAAHDLWTDAEQLNRKDIAANTGGAGRSAAATSNT